MIAVVVAGNNAKRGKSHENVSVLFWVRRLQEDFEQTSAVERIVFDNNIVDNLAKVRGYFTE